MTEIGEYAFQYNYITSVTIPNSVTEIVECAFGGCSSLISVDIPNSVTVIHESCPCVSRGEIGIFVLDGEAFIKEFGGNCLISRNPEYAPKMLTEFTRMVCLGRVLGKAEIIK